MFFSFILYLIHIININLYCRKGLVNLKNYCLNKVNSKYFILNYIVLNNQLIINYADGNIQYIPYSIENEKNILNAMKYQILNSKRFVNLLNQKFEIFLKLFLDELLLFILLIIASFNMQLISSIVGFSILTSVIGLTGYKLFKYNNIRNDIKKHLLFISNEDDLNIGIRNNPELVRGLDDKLKGKVLSKESNNFLFTINTIDKMKYDELKRVYKYVDQDIEEEKHKKLSRRRVR